MGVDNHHNTAALFPNFRVHLDYLGVGKVLRIELKVFVTLRIIVLLCPLDIGPQVVDRESIIREIPISIYQHLSWDRSPLAEMIAKSGKEWHWCESRDCGQVFINILYAVHLALGLCCTTKHEELEDVCLRWEGDFSSLAVSVNINKSICWVDPEHWHCCCLIQTHHIGNGSVKRTGLVGGVAMVSCK